MRNNACLRIFVKTAFFVLCCCVQVSDRCSTEEIHTATSMCLRDSMVHPSTDPLVPVLNDTTAVVNFCLYRYDMRVRSCTEYNNGCEGSDPGGRQPRSAVSIVLRPLRTSARLDQQYNEDLSERCRALQASMDVMHQYLATILFPCNDVATTYYPCTLVQLNVNAIDCFAKNGLIISNALVPTPGSLSNADEMCSAKSTIQSCIRSHITRCLHEPQVTTLFGTAVEYYEAAFNCMCSLENFDMVLSCAATADVTSAMTQFTSKVHNHSIDGTLDKRTQCSLGKVMAAQMEKAPGVTYHVRWSRACHAHAYK